MPRRREIRSYSLRKPFPLTGGHAHRFDTGRLGPNGEHGHFASGEYLEVPVGAVPLFFEARDLLNRSTRDRHAANFPTLRRVVQEAIGPPTHATVHGIRECTEHTPTQRSDLESSLTHECHLQAVR